MQSILKFRFALAAVMATGFGLIELSLHSRAVHAQAATTSPAPAFAVRNVRVFDGEHTLAKANVVVRDGRIVAVGADAKIPADMTVVDGNGKTLLPGLIDAHVHSWGDSQRDALRFGVTTELDMFTDWHMLAAAKQQRVALGKTDQSDLWSSGTLATVKGGHGTEYGMDIPLIENAGEAQAFVEARIKEGSDYLKIILDDGSAYGPNVHLPTLTPDEVKALIGAAHENHKFAVIHIAKQSDARLAIEDGVDGLAHIFADSVADPQIIRLAQQKHTFVIATLAVNASSSGAGEGRKLRDDTRVKPFLSAEQYEMLGKDFSHPHPQFIVNATENVRRLHAAGVPILAGTDAGNPGTTHGASLHDELVLLTKAGLTPSAALAAATALPAKYFHLDDRGRIAVGLRADLLLVDGDPTQDITATLAIAQVWKNGYAVERALKVGQKPDQPAASKAPAEALVSDFDGDAIVSKYGQGWASTTDTAVGGKSVVTQKLVVGGAQGTRGALDVSGEIKAGFAYPWAGAIFFPGETSRAPVDFSAKKEIVFWTRGDGRNYTAMLFSGSSQMPLMQDFSAGAEWKEVHLPLAAFSGADMARVRGFAFCAGTPVGAFDFAIDQVEVR